MKVLGVSGSLRSGSYNTGLLRAAQMLAPEGMDIEIYELRGIPLYDFDVESSGDPPSVTAFKQAIADADALLISTPEYQHGVPGVLKNALDWASRPPGHAVLWGKPVAIMGASPSLTGTARAQSQLREVLCFNNMPAVPQPEVRVAFAHEKFTSDGEFADEGGKKFVRKLLVNLKRLAENAIRETAEVR